MKRNLSLRYLATALVLASGLVTAANAADATLSPGKLKIAMEVAYPPFESWQDDKIVGFDAELAALLKPKSGPDATARGHQIWQSDPRPERGASGCGHLRALYHCGAYPAGGCDPLC